MACGRTVSMTQRPALTLLICSVFDPWLLVVCGFSIVYLFKKILPDEPVGILWMDFRSDPCPVLGGYVCHVSLINPGQWFKDDVMPG